MGWKRSLLEAYVWSVARCARTARAMPENPNSVFVLRNNDIGDLIVITPLFEALKKRFPAAKIIAGIGDWNRPMLQNNPHVDEILSINAPWHNLTVKPQGLSPARRYIRSSPEVAALRKLQCDIGIDVLGSPFGSLLLMRAGIPWRLGMRGYAGGHTATQQHIQFDDSISVGRGVLKYAELLGATHLPDTRPQIFLTPEEIAWGEAQWAFAKSGQKRIILGPGGGFEEKCWPLPSFVDLARQLSADGDYALAAIGGKKEIPAGQQIAAAAPGLKDFSGRTSLRETFALVAACDLVVCNSSMLMHAAAAFKKPAIVVLGEHFDSASHHAKLWGHTESIVLGKDAGRPTVFTVAEVHERLQQALKP